MSAAAGWPDLLEKRLDAKGYPHRVINASISGDTTRGGLARLPAALDRYQPAIVIVALGGNDGLRGLPPSEMEQNLSVIIERSQQSGAKVLLAGIQIPPNYGPAYTERFRAVYPELAGRYGIPLVPFLLEGVALDRELMQADGIHPKAEAQQLILDNVWPALKSLLDAAAPVAAVATVPPTG